MKRGSAFAAVDLGAESGRVVLGRLVGGKISLREVSRFANRAVELPDGLHWDIVSVFRESTAGIELALREESIESVGVDTWGVDYGLLDERGGLLGLPFHYRDRRTDGALERFALQMERAQAYETTGIRPMPINTVYQLLVEEGSAALQGADRLVLIPDLLAYWLCGVLANERTAASTTGLLDACAGEWQSDLIRGLGLPEQIFGRLVDPGTVLGPLAPLHVGESTLRQAVQVVATAGHDTASAFAGAPIGGRGVAVLSSGTWSLVGVELQGPVLNESARAADLSNERGVFGTVRLLRNVMGLWLLQRCRAEWGEQGSAPGYEELAQAAATAVGEPALFDPDHESLIHPKNMTAAIGTLITGNGQKVPGDRGGMVKSIFTSLACKYRAVVEALERVTGMPIDTIHIVGGGSKNSVLCQLAADITGREVLAGPAEATALGNILVQACTLGHLSGLEEMRQVARTSFPPTSYHPGGVAAVGEATYHRFLDLTGICGHDQGAPRKQGRNT